MTTFWTVSEHKEKTMDRKNIENIIPLAPLQEGILFHCLIAKDAGVYMPQMAYFLHGPIDTDRLRAAWEQLLARHSALRSAVHWEERPEPFQIVYRKLPLPFKLLDWQGTDAETELQALFESNRATPFDLRRPPLFRLHLAQVAEKEHILVLCFHHIILDGWSTAVLLHDLMTLYHGQATLPAARPYAEYIRWMKQQDSAVALQFWRDYIAGTPGPALSFGDASDAPRFQRREWLLPADLEATLTAFCAAEGVTLNTVLQAALGLYLAEKLGRDDVFFGSATSGRPADLAGSTQMIGLFINALPVRIRLSPGQSVRDWLTALQTAQAATMMHEHIALRHIQDGYGTLFDCLLVVENYPTGMGQDSNITLSRVEFDEWTHFPLTLLVAPEQGAMKLILRHDMARLSEEDVSVFTSRFATLLRGLIEAPEAEAMSLIGPVQSLPPLKPVRPVQAGQTRAAQTETEQLLVRLCTDLLKSPAPMASDNFFAIGGHSLLAAKLVAQVNATLSVGLTIRALFERPVLADLATHIDALRALAPPVQTTDIEVTF